MLNWLSEIPNLERNLSCGGVGALIGVLYELYRSLPEVQAGLFLPSQPSVTSRSLLKGITIVAAKTLLGVVCGATITSLLIQPSEMHGALITGLTWPIVLRGMIDGKTDK